MTCKTIDLKEFQTKVVPSWEKRRDFNVSYTIIIHGKPAFQISPFNNEEDDDEQAFDISLSRAFENKKNQEIFSKISKKLEQIG